VFQTAELICAWIVSTPYALARQFMRNLSLLRVLRALRLVRVLRVVRILHFLSDITVVTHAVMSSLRSLFGATVLLLITIYVVGITMMEVVTSHRIHLKQLAEEDDADIVFWWGGLGRSMQTACATILGGIDWDEIAVQLTRINPVWGIVFIGFVAFSMFCLMNFITGIFVHSALHYAGRVKSSSFEREVRKAFYDMQDLHEDQQGITLEQFEACLAQHGLQSRMQELAIETDDAVALFRYLESESATVDRDVLATGLLRLRHNARFIDIVMLLSEQQNNLRVPPMNDDNVAALSMNLRSSVVSDASLIGVEG